jgi:diguanylate cyclase (GGDEF)-like protein
MSQGIRLLLLLALLSLAPLPGVASESFEATLREADALRSVDADKFQVLLRELEARQDTATRVQRERLAYLHAYGLAYVGNYEAALKELRGLFQSATDVSVRVRAGALMVNSYAVTKQFTDGLRQLEDTMPLVPDVSDPDVRDHALAVASLIYGKMGQYKQALQFSERLLADSTSARSRCFAGQYRLDALQNLDQLPADDASMLAVIDECRALGEGTVTALARSNLARKWAAQGDLDKAIAFLQANLAEAEATKYPPAIGELHSVLAEYLLMRGNLQDARQHAERAIGQRADSGYSWYLVSAYKTLYEVAERGDDPLSALQHYRQYAEADKAYLTEVKTRELAYQIVRQEMLQKTQEIELLNRRNEVLQLQQRVDRQSAQSSRLLALLLTLLVGSIGYWAYKIKRVQLSLRRMAETDALTGICNRHHFSQQSEKTLQDGARAGEDVALIMFDLDHFKSINDRFGHVTGDWVLRRVSESCKSFCRRIDHIGRLGGEEFAILLSGCDLRGAMRVAEDCRVRIASIDTLPSGHRFVITASFGVTATSLSGYDLAKLLSNADMMLYRAKREGRNRVCAFDGSTTPVPLEAASPRDDEPASSRLLQVR